MIEKNARAFSRKINGRILIIMEENENTISFIKRLRTEKSKISVDSFLIALVAAWDKK